MPTAALTRLYQAQAADFEDAGLGGNLDDVRETLKLIRKEGCDISTGQVTAGVTGVAAPLFDGRQNVIGSLSLTIGETGVSSERLKLIADRVRFCARIVTNTMSRDEPQPIAREA
jgi:DNA-binding IclR family transcriptional regulator